MITVMILAAGRGERMRPLTDSCPKPMLKVQGKPLIEYHIEKLAEAGLSSIVINHAWLGQQIVNYLGNGERWGLRIKYSAETNGALETAGGIINALPLMQDSDYLLVVNGDIHCDFDFNKLPSLADNVDIHLWLTNNPLHHPKGDFSLIDGKVSERGNAKSACTYSGIGLFRLSFFKNVKQQTNVLALGPLLREAAKQGKVSGEMLQGKWTDVGTPERLALLNE